DQKPTNKANVVWESTNGDKFDKDLKASTKLNKETVDSSWKSGTYNPDTKEITWTIITNYRENEYNDFKIIDTPQGNQVLDEGSIELYHIGVEPNGDITDE